MITVDVPGGQCVCCDLFDIEHTLFPEFAVACMDPPFGGKIIKAKYDRISGAELAGKLLVLFAQLQERALPGAHIWMWGGMGTPGHRALYRTLIDVEECTGWKCAEQITWQKKRGYGTDWRCLMNREECLRFVNGDVKKPRVYHKQFTDKVRGYAGFNKKHPAKSEFKRLTMVWDHASDMQQNKPHQCHKPRPLAESQILSTTNPGDVVLDLFSGSGEVSLTARDHDRPFVAYEGDETEFEKLVARLRK